MGRKLTITAFILSLLFFIPLVPIIGVILAIIAFIKALHDPDALKWLALTAIVIGIFASYFNIFMIIGLFHSTLGQAILFSRIPKEAWGNEDFQRGYCCAACSDLGESTENLPCSEVISSYTGKLRLDVCKTYFENNPLTPIECKALRNNSGTG